MSPDVQPQENFPGGDVVPGEGELRISIEKKAYSELMAHCKEETDVEIGGFLLGKMKQDKHGPWLHLQQAIRGQKTENQGAQVKYTHDTWNAMYAIKDKEYPDLEISGWYHTHPGFDVFLSDYDKFIHNSWFYNPNQVAYVYDPHSGNEGYFRKVNDQIVQVDKYWHGGKQRKLIYPEQRAKAAAAVAAVTGGPAPSADALGALSNRVTQMEMELRQRQGGTLGNLLLFGMVALISILMFGYQLFFSRPHGQLKLLDIDPKTGDALYIEVFRQPPPDSMRPADPKDKKPEGPQEKK